MTKGPRNYFTHALERAHQVRPHLEALIEAARQVIDVTRFGEAERAPSGIFYVQDGQTTLAVFPGLDTTGTYWIMRTPVQRCRTCREVGQCRFGHCESCIDLADQRREARKSTA